MFTIMYKQFRQFVTPVVLSLVITFLITFPFEIQCGTIYKCVDKNGISILTTTPSINEYECTPIESYKEITPEERLNLEQEKQTAKAAKDAETVRRNEEATRKTRLNNCIRHADEGYRANWDSDCRLLKRPERCVLPPDRARRWDWLYQEEKNRCLQAYPQTPYPQK